MKNLRIAITLLLFLAMLGAAAKSVTSPAEVPEPDDRVVVRVMSYNIKHCLGTDDVLSVQRIANVIKAANPDIVALQEVDRLTTRSQRVDQAAELGRLTGMHVRFGKAINYQGGEYGQAILSRWPIESFDVHQLPTEAGQEQRIAIVATIRGDQRRPTIVFAGTHLHHADESLRLPQAVRLISLMRQYPQPVKLLAGDMNARPDSLTMQVIKADWVDLSPPNAHAIPSSNPNRKIDYVMAAKRHAWRLVGWQVINEPVASDHRPLMVTLEWQGGDSLFIR